MLRSAQGVEWMQVFHALAVAERFGTIVERHMHLRWASDQMLAAKTIGEPDLRTPVYLCTLW